METDYADTYYNPYYSYGHNSSSNFDVKAIAPHVSLGFEAAVSPRIAITAGVKQIIGEGELERDSNSSRSDLHIGGPEIKGGVRFYF